MLASDRRGTLYRALGALLVASAPDGARQWMHHFPGDARVMVLSDAKADGGVAALVAMGGTLKLTRLSETGELLWTAPVTPVSPFSASLVLDAAGGVVLVAPDLAGRNVSLVLFDGKGNARASLAWPDADSVRVARASDGKIIVARHSSKDIRFTWLTATGDAIAEHVWGVTATSFLMATDEDGTVVAVADSPWSDAYPPASTSHPYLHSTEPVFIKLSADGHVDYQLIPEEHGYGYLDVGRVDALGIDRQGNVWFEGNMTDRFGIGPFAAQNESYYDDPSGHPADALCGRFLAVLDRRGEPVWAHTLANHVPCKPRPVGLVTSRGGIVVAFNHRGDVPLHVPGESALARSTEGCRVVRFESLPPVELAARDYTVFPYPDRGRDLGVLVDGHRVP